MIKHCLPKTVILLFALVSSGRGAVILQPTSSSTNMGTTFPTTTSQAIDQSGLSLGYTSLSTDFDSYVSAQPTATAGTSTVWGSSSGVRSGNFDLALGSQYQIDGIAFWNFGRTDPSGIQQFSISVSNDSAFATSTTFTGFTASRPGTSFNADVQVFTFPTTSASYLRLTVLNTWSGSSFSAGFNEVAVRVVPEPGSAFLLGSSAFLLLTQRRRKTA